MAAHGRDEQAEDQGLDEAADDVVHGDGGGDAVEVGALVHVEHGHARQVAANDAHHVEDGGEQGEGDQGGGQARAHQIGHGVDVHDVEGVDLVRDAHDADLRRHGGSGAAGEHDGGEHGAELADEREGDHGAKKADGAELDERVVALESQHHAAEEADEQNEEEGLVADDIDLVEGPREDLGAGEDLGQALGKEDCHASHEADGVQKGPARGREYVVLH